MKTIDSNGFYAIPTYIINYGSYDLEKEKENIQEQFGPKREFKICRIYPKENCLDFPHKERWGALVDICNRSFAQGDDFVVVVKSSFEFNKSYSCEKLIQQIENAYKLGAKLLVGPVERYRDAIYLKHGLFWVHTIGETPFLILFKELFKDIIATMEYEFVYTFDVMLSLITSNKFLMSHNFGNESSDSKKNDFENTKNDLIKLRKDTLRLRKSSRMFNFDL